MYAVYDGHGGVEAAKYCGKHYHERVYQRIAKEWPAIRAAFQYNYDIWGGEGAMSQLQQSPTASEEASQAVAGFRHVILHALGNTFVEFDRELISLSDEEKWDSGATAAVVMLFGPHLFAANVGDAEIVVGSMRDGEKGGYAISASCSFTNIYIYVCVCVRVYICVYIYIYICVCVCVFVCICV